jgi:hypothetical protein
MHVNCVWMSCFNIFYISHFEEKYEFIGHIKKEMMFDKMDFAIKRYVVNEHRYSCNLKKSALTKQRKEEG